MRGIRWIVGIPIGYYVYYLIMKINVDFVRWGVKIVPYETFWSIEGLIANTFVAIYFAIAVAYFILPRDQFAIINNLKVKVLYYAISLWSVLQLIFLGVSVHDLFKNPYNGIVYQILYPILALMSMWWYHKGIALIDFKYNQPARDYLEMQQKINDNPDIIEMDR
ncbi:hypothetical protein [Cohnella zeiphila]|uniref:Uncharacterized protein n=1 Tax=Cohnella zeiphila TaxID=2761120 RepID=A0A7X0SKY7_9BACL|nr:hypothetical protein [Cohnella zeiphila]MBB6731930.1 hypothetical protein [Cohnella zeiphila]